MLSLLHAGEARIALPTWLFLAILGLVCSIQGSIVTNTRLSTRVKQIVSFPLLAAQVILPLMIAGHHRALTIVGGLFSFHLFLRFSEVIFVGPCVGREAVVAPEVLQEELWSCLKRPATAAENKEKHKQRETKRWYHLLPTIVGHLLLTDIVGSWFFTFDGQDLLRIQQDRPVLYLVFIALTAVILSAAINAYGYCLQLFYCLRYDQGSYCPDEWRPLMDNPLKATSLEELWSKRWHQVFRTAWLALAFRPVRTLASKITSRTPVALALASISVFFVSGIMHEYLALCAIGWKPYWSQFIGDECFFFTLHGVLVVFEKMVRAAIPSSWRHTPLSRIVGHCWVVGVTYVTFPWFVNAFGYFNLWHVNPFNALTPYLLDHVWRRYPILHSVCGSLL
ncbi:hypothetical protein BCR43DRAFT_525411 [Syncephalastrum racemosum]|uniref:Wax synthase domain-containing protein n=1 Tax=Syncephalastrum racemosum TaxID=13706 RepID=A0A1X2HAR2_SYNRA|nr:hypothetical protein BCR43DRAFT_525411 [Syncephalastrum racemosum]